MSGNTIESRQLTKRYGKYPALDNITLDIAENTITGVIGNNGAGKTTLLKLIAGFFRSSGGSITTLGHNPFESLYVSENCILVDENISFPKALRLQDILNEGQRFYLKWNQSLALKLCEYFGLSLQRRCNQLSKGQRSTFNVIFGLATRCALTIFDEPTNGMDVSVRKDFYRALLKDYIDTPRTILLSSHQVDEIQGLLETVVLLDKGKLMLHLPVDEVRDYAINQTGTSEGIPTELSDLLILLSKKRKGEIDNVFDTSCKKTDN